MTKKIIWRLANRPTPEDVMKLQGQGIITKDEAREILFNSEEEGERDKKSLESEIKFLRDLVEKLSNGTPTKIVEVIKEVRTPYYHYPWYGPYATWTSGLQSINAGNNLQYAVTTTAGNSLVYTAATSGSNNFTTTSGLAQVMPGKFSDIKTF